MISALLFLGAIAFAEQPVMEREFTRARGFTEDELRTLLLARRFDCDQRIYDADGVSINGVGALRIVQLTSDLFDFNFYTLMDWTRLGVATEESNVVAPDSERKILNLSRWKSGRSLKLKRQLIVGYETFMKPENIITIFDEFRILEDTLPKTLIVKETVGQGGPTAYLICN